ncbi:hypothetical protein J6V85_02835 [Candidatus Saccharibacteria bacterium]|nr:hypothetical protein [Candidatus Saccharibacteria bacterium]
MNRVLYFSLYSFLSLSLISGLILSSSSASAEEVVNVSNVDIAVPASCELSGTGTSHSANVNNGTYMEDIGKTTLTVFCNDGGGYAIYAVGYTGEEIGGTNSTKLVGVESSLTINTGTYTQGTTTDSVWSMKVSKVTDTSVSYNPANLTIENGFDAYSAVPAAYTKVASFTSTTDLTLGSKLETTYAAFVSGLQRADVYNGKVKYTLVHPSTIAGNTIYTMQSVASWKDGLSVGQTVSVMDTRDGKIYSAAKLADGNVWMTQNLDLDIDSTRTYTNKDTDIGYNTTTGEYETATWTPTRSTYTTTASQTTTWCQGGIQRFDGRCEDNYTPESYDPGDLYWNLSISDLSDWSTYFNNCDFSTSTPSCSGTNPVGTYTSSTGTQQYHLGNYYNWAAALATNDSSIYDNNDLVEQSICPAGWTLPRIGIGDDTFDALIENYSQNISNSWNSPLYFPASGYFEGALMEVGYIGNFWSPTGGGRGKSFIVNGESSYFGGQSAGHSVRCIARPVADSISLPEEV